MNNRRINLQKLLSLGYYIKINDGQAISGDPYAIIVDRNITDLEFDKIIDDKLQKVTTDFTWLTDVKMQTIDLCLVCKKFYFKQQYDITSNSVIMVDNCNANHFECLLRKFREKINYCKDFEI
jgi:hypothetical protein